MKICLIFPRFKYKSGDPPLGIAYVASTLEKNNFDVSILDTTFKPSFEYVKSYLTKKRPDIVGIYTDTLMFNDALKIINIAKKLDIITVAGGPHPTILPQTVIEHADIVVIGEGEKTFLEIIRNINTKSKNLSKLKNVEGIWYKHNKKIIKNNLRKYIKDINTISFPSRNLLDMEDYIKNWHYLDSVNTNLRGSNLVASRGCPYQCTYCQPTLNSLFGIKLRKRNPEDIIKEIKYMKKEYKLDGVFFHDDTFTIDKKWVKLFCNLVIKEKIKLIWACNARVNTLDEDLMRKMYSAGLRGLHLGVESGSQRILDEIYKKEIELEQVKKAVKLANKIGIHVLCFFMIGAPTETKKEINETIKFAYSLKCDEITVSITSPLPHTHLYNKVKEKGYNLSSNYDDFDYYSKRAFNDPKLSYRSLRYYQKKALILFYLHPYRWKYIFKHINSIKGWRKMFIKIKRFI